MNVATAWLRRSPETKPTRRRRSGSGILSRGGRRCDIALDLAAVVQVFGEQRLRRDPADLAQAEQHIAVGVGIAGITLQQGAIGGHRLGEPALALQDQGIGDAGPFMVRRDRQRRAGAGLRFGQPAQLGQGDGQVVVGVHVLRLLRERPPQGDFRFIEPVGAHQQQAQVAERLAVVRVEPGRHRHPVQGLLRSPAPVRHAAQQLPAERMLGKALDERTRRRIRCIDLPLREQRGGGVDLGRVGRAGAGEQPVDVVERRVLQAVGPAQRQQLRRSGKLARLDQRREIVEPVGHGRRVALEGGGVVRDRRGQVASLARQRGQRMVGAGMAGLEFEYRFIQGERLVQVAGRGFVAGGLHGLVDDLADLVGGGRGGHGGTIEHVHRQGQDGALALGASAARQEQLGAAGRLR